MPEIIINGSGVQYPLVVASGNYALVGGVSGTQHFPLSFTDSGDLRTSASLSIGSISISAGSKAYVIGKSGTNYFELLTDENGVLRTAGTVSVDSVYAKSGNVFIVSGNAWIGTGSVYVTNPAVVGSLAIQTILGSVALTNQDKNVYVQSGANWTGTGSVYLTNQSKDVFLVSGNQWNGTGSVYLTNTTVSGAGVFSIGSGNTAVQLVAATDGQSNPVAIAVNSLSKGWNGATWDRLKSDSGANIGIGALRVSVVPAPYSGGDIPVSVSNAVSVGSLATQGVLGSVAITNGSLNVYGALSASVDSAYIPSGNVAITNGSLNVYGTLSATVDSVYVTSGNVYIQSGVNWTGTGSVFLTNGSINTYGTLSVSSVYMPSGNVYVQSGVNWTGVGSVFAAGGSLNINNPQTIGSLAIQTILGSVAVTNTLTNNAFIVSGNAWAGVGSAYISNAVSVGSLAIQTVLGSVALTNQSKDVFVVSGNSWAGVGSAYAAGGSININNPQTIGSLATQGVIGSVAITNTLSNNAYVVSGTIGAGALMSSIYNGLTSLTPKFATIAASASGNTLVVGSVASKYILVHGLYVISSGATSLAFKSETTDITGFGAVGANGGMVLPFNPVGWFKTGSTEALRIALTAAGSIGGAIQYTEV